jgi:hypothetical protein
LRDRTFFENPEWVAMNGYRHDATKSYHLPIEKTYLESAVQDDLSKVPTRDFEFIIWEKS